MLRLSSRKIRIYWLSCLCLTTLLLLLTIAANLISDRFSTVSAHDGEGHGIGVGGNGQPGNQPLHAMGLTRRTVDTRYV